MGYSHGRYQIRRHRYSIEHGRSQCRYRLGKHLNLIARFPIRNFKSQHDVLRSNNLREENWARDYPCVKKIMLRALWRPRWLRILVASHLGDDKAKGVPLLTRRPEWLLHWNLVYPKITWRNPVQTRNHLPSKLLRWVRLREKQDQHRS